MHLARFGIDPNDLEGQIDEGIYGPTMFAVASGSIAAGYANASSDLDLYIVVDGKDADAGAMSVPIVSHELGVLVDTFYWNAAELVEMFSSLQSVPLFADLSEDPIDDWKRTHSSLRRAMRLAIGATVVSTPEWQDIQDDLQRDWLVNRAADWWRFQAWRHALSYSWLRERRPLVARQNLCDAALFALKCEVTDSGFAYFNPKWVSRELRELGWANRLTVYRSALADAAGGTGAGAPRETEAAVREIVGPVASDVSVYVAFLPGVEQRQIGNRTLVWRWDFNGIELPETGLPEEGVIWRGSVTEPPPTSVVDLVEHGLAWLGLTRATL